MMMMMMLHADADQTPLTPPCQHSATLGMKRTASSPTRRRNVRYVLVWGTRAFQAALLPPQWTQRNPSPPFRTALPGRPTLTALISPQTVQLRLLRTSHRPWAG